MGPLLQNPRASRRVSTVGTVCGTNVEVVGCWVFEAFVDCLTHDVRLAIACATYLQVDTACDIAQSSFQTCLMHSTRETKVLVMFITGCRTARSFHSPRVSSTNPCTQLTAGLLTFECFSAPASDLAVASSPVAHFVRFFQC